MNKWKFFFFALLFILLIGIGWLFWYIQQPSESTNSIQPSENVKGYTFQVSTTKQDLEGVANSYLQQEFGDAPLPITIKVNNQIQLQTELQIFSISIPVLMNFSPEVSGNGDIILKQKSVEVGKLDIPPSTVLKLMKDSIDLPTWMNVQHEKEQIYVQMANIPTSQNVEVRAKEIDLKENNLLFDIVFPTN
ncbi:YpmS family protein [Paenisporosarcina cavernae]|uniref:DUF2140 family protein n=1 Tax=Paenisporosarcina cavernae TaxID=2320858 RepID=A0A385YU41_9BACL|nr:YpmS family protein [Paenisporosarcina cavernae]AYC29447.1 DUF2140 family protein [Paenisporosarcina cavernae]